MLAVSASAVAGLAVAVPAVLVRGDVSAAPRLAGADRPLGPAAARGRATYERWCVGCHGEEGRGDGPAAALLDPLPCDLRSGRFEFRSAAPGEFPLASDLLRTVTCGLPGSSMPAFQLVPQPQRRDVLGYVLRLARLGLAEAEARSLVADEGLMIEEVRGDHLPRIRQEVEQRLAARRRVAVPAEPENSPESVTRGHALYEKLCIQCHGATGVGDGPSSATLGDWRDAPIRPRDFTSGAFRAGSAPEDLFLRGRTGLNGTPMPRYSNLSGEETWNVVHYILSRRDPRAPRPRMPPGCGPAEWDR